MPQPIITLNDGRQYGLGWRPGIPHQLAAFYEYRPDFPLITIPASVDLSTSFPATAWDQGSEGSCTGFAISYLHDYLRRQAGYGSLAGGRGAPAWIYYEERKREGSTQSDAGASISDGFWVLANEGICGEHFMPYRAGDYQTAPINQAVLDASEHKIGTYRTLGNDINKMKACLAGNTPFVFGFAIYSSGINAPNGDIPMPRSSDQMLGGHALCCIGYDDAAQRFRFINSWGTWGAGGRGTIPYAYLQSSQYAGDIWMADPFAPIGPGPSPVVDGVPVQWYALTGDPMRLVGSQEAGVTVEAGDTVKLTLPVPADTYMVRGNVTIVGIAGSRGDPGDESLPIAYAGGYVSVGAGDMDQRYVDGSPTFSLLNPTVPIIANGHECRVSGGQIAVYATNRVRVRFDLTSFARRTS
jgi:hypothetical protein